MKEVELSIITVTYNGLKDTRELIDSILALRCSFSIEIIVVDNASLKDEATQIKQEYPSVIAIRSEKNLGFAGGNNLGIDASSGKFLYFLNNDTLLHPNSAKEMEEMIHFLQDNAFIGGISPLIKYQKPSNLIQFAGCTPLSQITLRNYQIGYQKEDFGQYGCGTRIPYLHGAAMMIPRKILSEIGKMPECYFLYYEEMDWSTSIREKYELYYFPQATVYHKESATTGFDSPLKAYFLTRNRLIYAYRHRKGLVRFWAIAYQVMIASPTHVFKYIQSGKQQQAGAIMKGIAAFGRFLLHNK